MFFYPRSNSFFRCALLLSILCAGTSSCSKDDAPAPEPEAPTQEFQITFDATTISTAQVDSAFVVFQRKGTVNQYHLRFDKVDGKLSANIDGFRAGEWTAYLHVYGSAASGTSKREYIDTLVFQQGTIPQNVVHKGPKGGIEDVWEPYVLLTQNPELVVIVPLDNTNPYFEVRANNAAKWQSFYISRSAMFRLNSGSGNELKVEGSWDCPGACFTNGNYISDKTTFLQFSEAVKTKTWNNGEVDLIATDKQGNTTEFYIPYDI